MNKGEANWRPNWEDETTPPEVKRTVQIMLATICGGLIAAALLLWFNPARAASLLVEAHCKEGVCIIKQTDLALIVRAANTCTGDKSMKEEGTKMALLPGGKLRSVGSSLHEGIYGYSFWCPGCNHAHMIPVQGSLAWHFSGNTKRPSFQPSLVVYAIPNYSPQCHSVITDGRIAYCADSGHALAGQTVDMPLWPEDHMNWKDGSE